MLLDTSGLLCLSHADEPGHADAWTLFEAGGPRLTHNYVLVEYVALANARGLPRRNVLAFLAATLDHPDVELVRVDEPLHRAAMDLIEKQLDKRYSLCDAVSFVLMRQRGLIEALTSDHHFAQAGFVRLLSP